MGLPSESTLKIEVQKSKNASCGAAQHSTMRVNLTEGQVEIPRTTHQAESPAILHKVFSHSSASEAGSSGSSVPLQWPRPIGVGSRTGLSPNRSIQFPKDPNHIVFLSDYSGSDCSRSISDGVYQEEFGRIEVTNAFPRTQGSVEDVPLGEIPSLELGGYVPRFLATLGVSGPQDEEKLPSWSIGAEEHDLKKCRPCAYYWRQAGCCNGADCSFCHMCDEGAYHRMRKERIDRYRELRNSRRVADYSLRKENCEKALLSLSAPCDNSRCEADLHQKS